MTGIAIQGPREKLKENVFDGHIAREIRVNANFGRGDLVNFMIKRNPSRGYPVNFDVLCARIDRFERSLSIPKYRGPGDFDSDYLEVLAENGHNPYGLNLRDLQPLAQKGSREAS